MLVSFNCNGCGKPTKAAYQIRIRMCWTCYYVRDAERRRAIAAVANKVRKGELPKAKECTCVDCGKPASDWDHRDYMEPLKVEPVCRSCNLRRPLALSSAYRGPKVEA